MKNEVHDSTDAEIATFLSSIAVKNGFIMAFYHQVFVYRGKMQTSTFTLDGVVNSHIRTPLGSNIWDSTTSD